MFLYNRGQSNRMVMVKYVKKIKEIYRFHQHNRERDTAIVSLILGSGLRLSEVAGCNLEDLDIKKSLIHVIRKGNKEQFVYFSDQALNDIILYKVE